MQRTDSGREPSELCLSLMSETMKGNNNTNVVRDYRGTAVLETHECLVLFFFFTIVLSSGVCHLLRPNTLLLWLLCTGQTCSIRRLLITGTNVLRFIAVSGET